MTDMELIGPQRSASSIGWPSASATANVEAKTTVVIASATVTGSFDVQKDNKAPVTPMATDVPQTAMKMNEFVTAFATIESDNGLSQKVMQNSQGDKIAEFVSETPIAVKNTDTSDVTISKDKDGTNLASGINEFGKLWTQREGGIRIDR